MRQPGNKLRITGKGRCNITNNAPLSEFVKHIHPDGKKLRNAFSKFFSKHLIDLLIKIDVKTITERGGRIFPESEEANRVADALVWWCKKNGVHLKTNARVSKLIIENNRAAGVAVTKNFSKQIPETFHYAAKKIIIATGGLSYPATGSTGDGFSFAKSASHTITDLRPALVPLETAGDTAQKLQGLSLKNVMTGIWVNGQKYAEEFGEMLFTHFGVSGPIILTLSRIAVDELRKKSKVVLSIDLKPALDENKLDQRLLRDLDEHGKMKFGSMLKLLLPTKMIPVCCEILKINPEKLCNQVSADERKKLRLWLKNFSFEITGHRNFDEVIITAGGINIAEIDTNTFASKRTGNLYFAGEALDFDADTGGFNLQIAFTTGWVAAETAVAEL